MLCDAAGIGTHKSKTDQLGPNTIFHYCDNTIFFAIFAPIFYWEIVNLIYNENSQSL